MTTDEDDEELGLSNPYSCITCFILYMYSLEFGDPPLYSEINRVSRTMDRQYLEMLGPIAKAMSQITWDGERNREETDKIETGEKILDRMEGVEFNIAGTFLLWRGVQMKEEWIQPYEDASYVIEFDDGGEPHTICLPGNTSCSQNLEVALTFAT